MILISLPQCQVKLECDDLCPGTLISDVIYAGLQEFVIASTTQGSVYIYKVSNVFKLVHVFTGHTRNVPSLMLLGTIYFISASMDYTIKV